MRPLWLGGVAFSALIPVSSPAMQRGAPLKNFVAITAAVEIHERPAFDADILHRTAFGAELSAYAISTHTDSLNGRTAPWYQVDVPLPNSGEDQGWVWGGWLFEFEDRFTRMPRNVLPIARAVIAAPLRPTAEHFVDFVTYLDERVGKWPNDVPRDTRAMLVELELIRLEAIASALDRMPPLLGGYPLHRAWIASHGSDLAYGEPQGRWFVSSDAYWRLHDRYSDLPIADTIAWRAATVPIIGECEGWIPCMLRRAENRTLRYLSEHPTGGHIDDAVADVTRMTAYALERAAGTNLCAPYPEGQDLDPATLARLRTLLTAATGATGLAEAVAAIAELERLCGVPLAA